ncbi:MAG TPA: CPBP family intramembrane glutamic endopeptidase [Thermoplasmata archaeon]|nr:CPBP family intramembrane glutamic endopeptidase [Thermoplasmata archaeon]
MATATAHPTPAMPASRWPYLVAYLAAVIAAEVLIAIPAESNKLERPFQSIGLSIHILLVFTLMFLSVVIQPKDATLAPLLVAASLASLVRVFSLAVPRYNFLGLGPTGDFPDPVTNPLNTIPWLALVSVPLLVSVAAVAYVQRLRPRDLGLALHRWPELAQQTAIALTGIPLGFLEFFILRPDAWIEQLTLGSLLLGGVVIFFATGFSEELIFRAILLKRAVEGLGRRGGLLYVTAIFASLHIFFLSGVDLVFVFAVGLFYGFIVLRTRNLWGVILSHSLGNVILYLVAPFLGR